MTILCHFIGLQIRRAFASAAATLPFTSFQLIVSIRSEGGALEHGVIDVRDGVVSVGDLTKADTRLPYASLQLAERQAAELLRGASIEPELAFETAPLLAMIAAAIKRSGGVSPWQSRL